MLRGKAGEECVLRGSAEPAGTASPQDAGTPLRGPPLINASFIGIFRGGVR